MSPDSNAAVSSTGAACNTPTLAGYGASGMDATALIPATSGFCAGTGGANLDPVGYTPADDETRITELVRTHASGVCSQTVS